MSDIHGPDDSQFPDADGDGAPDLPLPDEQSAQIWSSGDEDSSPGVAADLPEDWTDQHPESAPADAEPADAAEEPVDEVHSDEAAADPFDVDEGGGEGADPLGDAVGSALADGGFDAVWNSPGAVTGWSGTAVAPEPAVTAWAVGVEDPDPDYIDPNLLEV